MILALRTGIAPSVWKEENERTIATAWQLLIDQQEQQKSQEAPLKPGQKVWEG